MTENGKNYINKKRRPKALTYLGDLIGQDKKDNPLEELKTPLNTNMKTNKINDINCTPTMVKSKEGARMVKADAFCDLISEAVEKRKVWQKLKSDIQARALNKNSSFTVYLDGDQEIYIRSTPPGMIDNLLSSWDDLVDEQVRIIDAEILNIILNYQNTI